MSITVYWACLESEWMRASEPESIYKNFFQEEKNKKTAMTECPAVKDYIKNTFGLKSLYDYEFGITEDSFKVKSSLYNQEFYDKHVLVRSLDDKIFSFGQTFIFFTEEKSLIMSANILPYLEDNNITERCLTIPGQFDIGKWFRLVDFVFYLKKNYNSFKIEEGEIFEYIKFHTKEKIIFKQFRADEKIMSYIKDCFDSRDNRKPEKRKLDWFYSIFKHKKIILKTIKENLL